MGFALYTRAGPAKLSLEKENTMANVLTYSLGYSISDKKFLFNYTLEGDNAAHQIFPTAEEFIALAKMFSKAGSVSFNANGNFFVTDFQNVGSGNF
jgi:hypothetical protein